MTRALAYLIQIQSGASLGPGFLTVKGRAPGSIIGLSRYSPQ